MEAIVEIFSNGDLTALLIAWAGKLVLALLIYIIGKWVGWTWCSASLTTMT